MDDAGGGDDIIECNMATAIVREDGDCICARLKQRGIKNGYLNKHTEEDKISIRYFKWVR